jgi:hypothetical protein
VLKLTLAAVLGLATALLVACGGGGRGLISSADAGPLKSDFDNVANAVSSGDCAATRSALSQARHDLAALPQTVDSRLRAKLGEGLRNLARNALVDCAKNQTQTTTTQTTQTTQTTAPPTTTQTTPPTTQTQTTETSPPPTGTQTAPPGPPAGSGGGTAAPGGGAGTGNGNGNGGAGANNGGGTPGQ